MKLVQTLKCEVCNASKPVTCYNPELGRDVESAARWYHANHPCSCFPRFGSPFDETVFLRFMDHQELLGISTGRCMWKLTSKWEDE